MLRWNVARPQRIATGFLISKRTMCSGAWLPESEGPWMPKGGKWTEIDRLRLWPLVRTSK